MELMEYLKKVAYKDIIDISGSESEVWKSTFDNSYLAHVGRV